MADWSYAMWLKLDDERTRLMLDADDPHVLALVARYTVACGYLARRMGRTFLGEPETWTGK